MRGTGGRPPLSPEVAGLFRLSRDPGRRWPRRTDDDDVVRGPHLLRPRRPAQGALSPRGKKSPFSEGAGVWVRAGGSGLLISLRAKRAGISNSLSRPSLSGPHSWPLSRPVTNVSYAANPFEELKDRTPWNGRNGRPEGPIGSPQRPRQNSSASSKCGQKKRGDPCALAAAAPLRETPPGERAGGRRRASGGGGRGQPYGSRPGRRAPPRRRGG